MTTYRASTQAQLDHHLLVATSSDEVELTGSGTFSILKTTQPRIVTRDSSQPRIVTRDSSQPLIDTRDSSQPRIDTRDSSQPGESLS